ncbi:MAG: lipid II flippase MurJ [Acidimicrobiales bacterium]
MSGSQRVAAGIFASRAVGLVREVVITAALGAGPATDAFRAAMRIPNLLQNLLGEGSISASFVPVYARLLEEHRLPEARTLTRQALGLLSATVVALVALIVLAARPLVWLTTLGGWSGDRYELAIALTRITALGTGLLVLSALCLGVLNAHRRYFVAYSAPVVWSAAQIVALLVALTVDAAPDQVARWAAIAMVVGSVGQLVVQLPTLLRAEGDIPVPSFARGPHLREALRQFAPAVSGRGIVQLSSYVDLALVGLLTVGALATITLVMPLYLLAIAVFGFSVAVSELTEMSRSTGGVAAVAARLRAAQRRVLLPAGLITAGAIGGGSVVIGFLYEDVGRMFGGDDPLTSFDAANTTVAAAALAAFALGLPATMVARVSQNALYALRDARTPARIAAVRLVVGAVIGVFAMFQLDHLAVGSLDRMRTVDGLADASDDELVAVASDALGVAVGDGPWGTWQVGDFPTASPLSPLPQRESFFAGDGDGGRSGTPFVHFGAVGLGLGSAAASWTEWWLLRRAVQRRLGESVATGLGPPVAAAGVGALVTGAAVTTIGLPAVADVMVLGVAVAAVYVAALWFIGVRPRHAERHRASE